MDQTQNSKSKTQNFPGKRIRVGVLFGGQSGEHEVSIVSGRAVIAGLDAAKYDVVPIGITREGRWLTGGDPLAELEALADPQRLPGGAPEHAEAQQPPASALIPAASRAVSAAFDEDPLLGSLDVIFPVLHGPMGEDGTVQGLLELARIPYVGCGVLASAVGMDKAMMKVAFAAAGLPLVPWLLLARSDWRRDREQSLARVEEQLRYPIFVKPASLGSSVGITRATDRATLAAGLDEAARHGRRIVVEQGIAAREIEISVLGNETVETSVPGEVVPSNEWYDYEAKYLAGQSQILIPAPISGALAARVRELAARAFKAIDGAGLARVDFLLDRDNQTLFVNEINTMPGFTPISMYAKMWEASGLPYSRLLDRLIELAFERHRE